MKYSIKIKTTLLVAIIIIALVSSLLLATVFLAEPVMIRHQKANIRTLYHSIEAGYSDDSATLSALVEGYEEGSFLQVEIFDEQGSLIYTSGRKMNEGFGGIPGGFPGMPGMRGEEEKMRQPDTAAYSEGPAVQRFTRGDGEILAIYGIIRPENGIRYVSIETPVEAITGSVAVLNRLTLVIAVLITLLGCGAAYLYAKKFSKPIIQISETAKQVAALDFSHRAEEQSSTAEIADLAQSINQMSGQLENFIGQLVEKNHQLEEDNRRLAREEEMRRSFVANVSHDLKSPLAVLGGYAEMLKEHTEGIDPEACYDVIIEETAVMNEMIRSMLEVSALENGLKELQTMPLELSSFLAELTGRERPLLEKKGLRLETALQEGITVSADPEQLARAVMNILQNAKAHCRPGGRIALTLLRDEAGVLLSIYNDGAPIPPEKIDKIWASFYKTDEARTRKEENNVGLGLYIVKTIITAHGGSCGAVNEEGGVRFWIRFPE